MTQHLFPLAVISDEVSQEINRVIAFATEFRLDGIEVRSLFGRAFKDLTPADVKEIGARFRDGGLKVAGCASPVFKCDIDKPSDIAAHIDIFKRSVEKAQGWGCDLVRVFAFHRKNMPSPSEDLKRAASHFPKLLEAAKGAGVRIGLENEHTTMVGSGTELRDFLKLLDSFDSGNKVIAVWDPCNAVCMPASGDPMIVDYPLVAGRVGHVHVKDAKRENGKPPDHCAELGTGDVPFPKLFAQLKQRGYKGWVSLETHWRMKALSSEAQHLPAGHSFSADAEPASRVCMAHLVQMLKAV
ncbi:MAG: sugar phosphate isomerase/epimerase [Verrucomicrobia bacterium]|nr:sugar phosphate isomerase/epimerase [Verrucomicrobiota bacterium]